MAVEPNTMTMEQNTVVEPKPEQNVIKYCIVGVACLALHNIFTGLKMRLLPGPRPWM